MPRGEPLAHPKFQGAKGNHFRALFKFLSVFMHLKILNLRILLKAKISRSILILTSSFDPEGIRFRQVYMAPCVTYFDTMTVCV